MKLFFRVKRCTWLATRTWGRLNPTVQTTGISPTVTLLPPRFRTNSGITVGSETKLMANENNAPSQTFATKLCRTSLAFSSRAAWRSVSRTVDLDLPRRKFDPGKSASANLFKVESLTAKLFHHAVELVPR